MPDLKQGVIAAARGGAWLWRTAPSAWLIAAAMGVSIALHLVPLYLPIVGTWATHFIHDKVAADLLHSADGRVLGHDELEPAVARWMAQNAETVASLQRQAERRFRDALTFEGEDGRRHVYLGGNDGYYWLQLARTELARGSVCDRSDHGDCIDAFGNAPMGQAIEYTDSPHVHAIAALHRVMTWLIPGFPLSSTSYLVPLLLSAAMVIPAFLLARQLSNRFGGLFAALALSLNSVVFYRTIDSDDDIWEVALPVLATTLLGAAFARARWIARVALAGLAGGAFAVLAAAWKGWPLFGLSALAGLLGIAAWGAIDGLLARLRRRPQSWDIPATAAAAMLSALAGFAITGPLLGVQLDLGIIKGGIAGVIGAGPRALAPIDTAPMPDVFRTVAELVSSDAESIAGPFGPFALGLGLLGFALPFYAPDPRRLWGAAALGLAFVSAAAYLTHFGAGRGLTVGLVLALALGAALAGWLRKVPIPAPTAAAGILGLAWLGATLWMSFDGYRFILLVAVPLSIAAGVGVGRLCAAVVAAAWAARIPYRIGGVVAAGGLAAAVIGPIADRGIGEAYWQYPLVTSAWAGAFAAVRQDSDRNAIVDTWWDYG
ncbi:MAG: STT3 domain-containing protein, partial [Stellaceae bacterium]